MALRQNIIYIYFKGKHQVTSKSQYQYNRKQYLYFADLNLPQVFEVHFSNRDKGESKTQIGNDKLVEIPDEYFWNGALQIYAWIYLHSGADDSETIYEIRIPLTKRAKPTDEEPLPVQQSAIDKAIAELNNAVNVTTENVNKTESDKIIVANIKDEVVDLKEDIDSTATIINQKTQETIDASGRAETSALNAADSERKALNYSQQAEQSAQEALESKNIAKQKAEIATGASAEALGYRDEAVNARDIAVQAKQNIVDYRDETKGYRDETLNLKNNVQTLKNQIDETVEEIEDISDSVKEDAQSASQSASSANQSSINASESASQAGQFADGAEQSANQAEQSMNMTEDYKNQSETFKNQAEQFKNQSETNVSHYPKIVNDYWYVWDATNEEYINTNVDANGIKGDTGRGIASIALNDDYTLTITFTDDTTYTTSSIRGQQGEKGDTGRTGESGVYIGTDEPENEDVKVWIDTDDDGTSEDLVKSIESLKENIYKPYVVDSASGSIASFVDGADDIPLKSLTVTLEPQQDLHGYDSPWVGGGGKNLLPSEITKNAPTQITFDKSKAVKLRQGNSYVLSFEEMSNATSWRMAFTIYDESEERITTVGDIESTAFNWNPSGRYYVTGTAGAAKLFKFTANANYYAMFFLVLGDVTDETVTVHAQVEVGTDATDWTPYENICPITGWTGCEVSACGINLFDKSVDISANNYYYNTTGEKVTASNYCSTDFIKIKGGTTYFWAINGVPPIGNASHNAPRVAYFDKDKRWLSSGKVLGTDGSSSTAPSNAVYVVLPVYTRSQTAVDKAMFVEGSTLPTTYVPYTGTLIPINWQTEAGTVYGGKLDVLTGKLTIEMADVDLGTLTWTYQESYHRFNSSGIASRVKIPSSSNVNIGGLCSAYVVRSVSQVILSNNGLGVSTSGTIGIIDTRFTDPTEFKSAVDGVHYIYPLATPIEIQLTPHEVNSLLGQNNIFADTEDTHVEYRADTKLYINKKIAEALASLT